MRDLTHYAIVFAMLSSGVIALFAVVSVPVYIVESYKCREYSDRTNRFTDYRFATGCFVEGMPIKEFTARAVTNEQR